MARQEDRYQTVDLQLMTEVASMERFHDIEKLEDADQIFFQWVGWWLRLGLWR